MFVEHFRPLHLNTDADDASMELGQYTLLENGRTMSAEQKGTLESIRGTVELPNLETYQGGKCIGSFAQGGRMVAFFTKVNQLLVALYENGSWRSVAASFSLGSISRIGGVAMVENSVYFTIDQGYREAFTFQIGPGITTINVNSTAIKRPPFRPSIASRSTLSSQKVNLIGLDSYQFTYRYVYKDKGVSAFSPLSDLYPGDALYDINNTRNMYRVSTFSDSTILPELDFIEVGYMKNNDGQINIFARVDAPSSGNVVFFTGTEQTYTVDPLEANQTFVPFPRARQMAHIEGRNFFADLEYNYNLGSLTSDWLMGSELVGPANTDMYNVARGGSQFRIGAILYDEYMRSVGVVSDDLYAAPVSTAASSAAEMTGYDGSNMYRPLPTVTMRNIPSWAKYFQFAQTKDTSADVYVQTTVNFFMYLREADSATAFNGLLVNIQGKAFWNRLGPTQTWPFNLLYLQVPDNLPITPEKGMYVKMLSGNTAKGQTRPILDVIGNWVVVEDFGVNMKTETALGWFVEIYKPSLVTNELFYPVGPVVPVSGTTQTFKNVLPGQDHLIRTGDKPSTRYILPELKPDDDEDDKLLYGVVSKPLLAVFTPTPIFTSRGETTVVERQSIEDGKKQYRYSIQGGYSFDYTKIAFSGGRPTTKIYRPGAESLPTGIAFTNPYVAGSNINGLSTMRSVDREILPTNRGRIRKLAVVGGVLLAVHEQATTSVYIGEGFVRQGDDGIFAKTEGVIGDDRELQGSAGTIHPDSFQEMDEQAFWWCDDKGMVIRYTNAGLYAIGNNLMRQYFKSKAGKYRGKNVIGMIDSDRQQYILQFPAITGVPAHAIALHIPSERWEAYYDYADSRGVWPEHHAYLGADVFSWTGGRFYQHHKGEYLKLFGVNKTRRLVIPVTIDPNLQMRYLNLHMKIDQLTHLTEGAAVEYETSTNQRSISLVQEETREGEVSYLPIQFDTANGIGSTDNQLWNGEQLRGTTIIVKHDFRGNSVNRLKDMALVFTPANYTR